MVGTDNAETLMGISRRIRTNTGQLLTIHANKAPLPCANLDDRLIEVIKTAMSRLYNLETRVMDLSNFRQADEFKKHGLFIAPGKANITRTITQIITENTPDLQALNLRENKMNFLEFLRPLASKCFSLKALDLSKNKVCFIPMCL